MCALKAPRKAPLNREAAETMALKALGFLAEDPPRLQRFLSLTGLDPAALRDQANSLTVLAAVLEFLLADETLLLVFAANAQVAPETVSAAANLLGTAEGGGT
jgi:hypothetical protein